ncbi:acyl-CoA carboxylase subunit epsilon [Amycolatopsis azurea]|uniref:Acyl-CoA carboxylase subunit epsilon n=1 Tax=Amycolatopsis azurea DSM 43854 TaxID=1238180 RepID=A0ABX3J305_9PSEU|nr:acyl-CoA carboxylase subunit epsilon [Amycolatopsis azurea]OOC01398.1 hypothetical protein B0293_38040 [Amycolatopsis azurea DSM 43854]
MTEIRVVRGDPTPTRIAALTMALLAVPRTTTEPPKSAGTAPWCRGGDVPDWASKSRPGWKT